MSTEQLCNGCGSGGTIEHSKDCLFEYFKCYTQFYKEPEDIQKKIEKAYLDGYDIGFDHGKASIEIAEPIFSAMGLPEVKFPSF